jgi:hypothetical protein
MGLSGGSGTGLKKTDLQELHYICPIENLQSIMANGILSNKRAAKLEHRSVAMQEIQERRKKIVVPGARPLHEYANLYLNARNKMMFKIVRNEDVTGICVLRIDHNVLDLAGVVIADQNASSGYARFGPSPNGLSQISKELVFAQYWNHPDDPIESMRHGSIVCAEVLVPDRLDPGYIIGAYVASQQAAQAVSVAAPGLNVTVNAYLFFH